MPVLAANQVTLSEVLEVKGSPLNEEEIWAVLSQAGKAIEQVLAEGKLQSQIGESSVAMWFNHSPFTCDGTGLICCIGRRYSQYDS